VLGRWAGCRGWPGRGGDPFLAEEFGEGGAVVRAAEDVCAGFQRGPGSERAGVDDVVAEAVDEVEDGGTGRRDVAGQRGRRPASLPAPR
jgi:hypothetical protein